MMRSTIFWAAVAAICATIAVVNPADAQYTVDTAISDSVLGETRKVGDKAAAPGRMTDKQLVFWRDHCAKWPKGGSCDRYRAEAARRTKEKRR